MKDHQAQACPWKKETRLWKAHSKEQLKKNCVAYVVVGFCLIHVQARTRLGALGKPVPRL
jgi:hypothetical protein